jgi:adenine deaminase
VDVFRYASYNPSRAIGFTDRGQIGIGLRADLIVVDHKINVSQVYINGELIGSGSYTGKVGVHSTEAIGTAFCFGADIASTGKGTDFPMTNFVLADAKIYAHALNFKQAETAYAKAVENFGK